MIEPFQDGYDESSPLLQKPTSPWDSERDETPFTYFIVFIHVGSLEMGLSQTGEKLDGLYPLEFLPLLGMGKTPHFSPAGWVALLDDDGSGAWC